MLRPNGGGSSGEKNDPVSGCRNFLIARTPKDVQTKHSLGILVSNLTLRTDICSFFCFSTSCCLHFLIATTVSSVRSPVRNLRFWVLQPGISVHICQQKKRQLPEQVRIFWGLNGIYGRLLAWPSSHGKPLVGDDYIEFSTKNGPGKQSPRYTFPLKVGWKIVPKHPQFWNCAVTLFSQQLVNILYRYSSKTNTVISSSMQFTMYSQSIHTW